MIEDLGDTRNKYYALVKKIETLQRFYMFSENDYSREIVHEKDDDGDWVKWDDIKKIIL